MTYGQIAELLDTDEERYTAQTVGWAMHALGDRGPWARVINSKGGCSTGKVMVPGNKQQFILEQEGIVFDENGHCDLERYLFIPHRAVVDEWTGCYDQSWKGIVIEPAFAHPAK